MKCYLVSLLCVLALRDSVLAQSNASTGNMSKDMISYELLNPNDNIALQLSEMTQAELWALEYQNTSTPSLNTEAGFSSSYKKIK